MKLSTSTFPAKYIGFQNALTLIADAGFDAIDFGATEEHYTNTHDKAFYQDCRKYIEDRGLIFNQAHAPFPCSFGDEQKDAERFNDIVTAMRISSWLGVKNIIVHPCLHLDYLGEGNPERLFEINMDFYNRLLPYCEEFDINIALENIWQNKGFVYHSACSRPEEFLRYLNTLNNKRFTACLDTGHAILVKQRPDEMVRILDKHLGCLHVHDVDGIKDSHTLPYHGIIEWSSFLKALADVDYKGDFTYEASHFFSRTPQKLWPETFRYMAFIGRSMIEEIESYKK